MIYFLGNSFENGIYCATSLHYILYLVEYYDSYIIILTYWVKRKYTDVKESKLQTKVTLVLICGEMKTKVKNIHDERIVHRKQSHREADRVRWTGYGKVILKKLHKKLIEQFFFFFG